jgi:O-antigen/teichoic acid export membrane protein
MTDLNKITRNTLSLFLNRIAVSVVNFGVGILVIRYLGATRFGEYSFVFAFLSFFSVFAGGSGIDLILVREVAKGNEADDVRRKVTTAVALRIVLGIFGALLAVTGALILYDGSPVLAYIVASSVCLFFSFHETNSPLIVHYTTRLELFFPQLIGTGILLSAALLKLFLVYFVRPGVLAFILVDAAAPVVISISYWFLFRRTAGPLRLGDISLMEARYLVKESIPIFLSSLCIMIYLRIDQILIGRWLGSEALGNYGVAVRIAEVFNFVPVFLSVSLLPFFSKSLLDANRKDVYAVSFRFMNLVVFPVILFFTFYSGEAIALLVPGQFPLAPGALRVLIWSEFFVFAGVIHSTVILANGLQRYYIFFFALQAVSSIVLNWLLIPRMSIVGAAWASVISNGVGILAALLVPEVRGYTRILLRSSTTFLAISLAVTAFLLAVPDVPKAPLCMVAMVLLVLTGLKKQDLGIIGGILNGLRLPRRQP